MYFKCLFIAIMLLILSSCSFSSNNDTDNQGMDQTNTGVIPVNDAGEVVNEQGEVVSQEITQISLIETLENDDVSFTSVYPQVKAFPSEIPVNMYEVMYDEFIKNVNTAEDFERYLNEFGRDSIFVSIVKNKDRDLWEKYVSLFYDSESVKGDEEFATRLTYYVEPGQDVRERFVEVMMELYDSFPTSDESVITPTMSDSYAVFNEFSLERSLEICSIIEYVNTSEASINACKDKIYFYRATSENNYCENIIDDYEKQMCLDSLTVIQ